MIISALHYHLGNKVINLLTGSFNQFYSFTQLCNIHEEEFSVTS